MSDKIAGYVFISHSHKDQAQAYALTEWLSRVWPAAQFFLTHAGLSHREQLEPHSYLQAVPGVRAILCLLTENSMTSNAVFDELDVARAAGVPVFLTFAPKRTSEDQRVYSNLEPMWTPKYGAAHDLSSRDGQRRLIASLQPIMSVAPSADAPDANEIFDKAREAPSLSNVSAPDRAAVDANELSHDDALKYLTMCEVEAENQALARGGAAFAKHHGDALSIPARIAIVFIWTPPEAWPDLWRKFTTLLTDELPNQIQLWGNRACDLGVPTGHIMKLIRFVRDARSGSI